VSQSESHSSTTGVMGQTMALSGLFAAPAGRTRCAPVPPPHFVELRGDNFRSSQPGHGTEPHNVCGQGDEA
jgi:hypothetical protein